MGNLSQTIRTFNRFELKYIVPIQQAQKFMAVLKAYLVPDDHGDGDGSYYLSNLYYDSPGFRFYWEKVDGIRFRRKLRIRYYEAAGALTDETPVFVEIKQRVDRVTQKRRVCLPYREARLLCQQRQVPAHEPADAPVIDEITTLLWQYNLRPVSLVRYARKALVGTDYDIGLRVTFDQDLAYRAGSPGSFDQPLDGVQGSLPLFPAGWTIIEIKVNERIPYWLTELVAAHNLNLVRVSKYCRSIALAQGLALPTAHL